jgi:predicted nucleotidyltransferase
LDTKEALATAVNVQVDTQTQVQVASLAGLALLKLFAWLDRGTENSKDALDLVTLFRNYPEAGNQERIYGEEMAVLEDLGYDMNLVGPRLLGIDVSRVAARATLEKAVAALGDTKTRDRLSLHMAQQLGYADGPVVAAGILLDQFRIGLQGQ